MFKSPGKRTSENEAMEQLRKQRRQASQLQTQYKSMLKEINDILKDDFTQIPCVLNALRSGTYKASTLAAAKSSSNDKSAELFNHNVVLWKDTPVNFYLKHLLSRGFSEQALNYAGTLSKHIPLHLFLICYALEGSWKIASKRIETADAKLNSRYDRCGKRGDALATRATFDFISSVPSEKACPQGSQANLVCAPGVPLEWCGLWGSKGASIVVFLLHFPLRLLFVVCLHAGCV